MTLIEYFHSGRPAEWIDRIGACDWSAAKFLAELLNSGRFHDILGEGELFILSDGDKVVSFATLTRYDCIDDVSLFPWIGFVFTSPEYRGMGHASEIVSHAALAAHRRGYLKSIWLQTMSDFTKNSVLHTLIPDPISMAERAEYTIKVYRRQT